MGYLKYKGYTGNVQYSEEDNILFGKVMGMSKDLILYEGKDVESLTKDFKGAIDDYLDHCQKSGEEPKKPFTGTLNVRISPDTHSKIAFSAKEKGISINALIKETLEKAVQ